MTGGRNQPVVGGRTATTTNGGTATAGGRGAAVLSNVPTLWRKATRTADTTRLVPEAAVGAPRSATERPNKCNRADSEASRLTGVYSMSFLIRKGALRKRRQIIIEERD